MTVRLFLLYVTLQSHYRDIQIFYKASLYHQNITNYSPQAYRGQICEDIFRLVLCSLKGIQIQSGRIEEY